MRIVPNRRSVLTGFGAGLILGPARGLARGGLATLATLARLATDNHKLAPITLLPGGLAFAGDRTLGRISTAGLEVDWQSRHGFDSPAEFRPRLADEVLICGGRRWLAAYDLASGAEIWRHVAKIQTGVPYVGAQEVVFGDGHRIMALDLKTGQERWHFDGVPETLASYAPTATQDTVYAGPGDGHLYALALDGGALRWKVDGLERWQYLRQIQIDGKVLVAGSYKEILTGLSLETGETLWEFNAGNFINSQHVAHGAAYLWSPTGWIYAIDSQSGRVRWRHLTTDYDQSAGNWASVLAEVQSTDDRLYVLDLEDVLHVIDQATGEIHQAAEVPGAIRHAVLPIPGLGLAFPTLSGEVLVTADL